MVASASPVVIGHRGASGYVPEHTLTSYFIAIQQGAHYIEPDLVMTRDGVLIARHENEIGGTTDISAHPEFAARKTFRIVDGERVEGWFTEDFTLAELKTLRARERIPQLRAHNARFNDQFEIPTFDEILAFVRSIDKRIGVYPETKHPTYFRSLGLPMEEALLRSLEKGGYAGRDAPVFIQSFEVGNLRALRGKTRLPLVQLMSVSGAPYDFTASGDPRTYADMASAAGLAEIATYANAIGVEKGMIIPRTAEGNLGTPTSLIRDAHAAGLKVHAWTFRAENEFLPKNFKVGADRAAPGNLDAEIKAFLATGLDGFFTDQPDLGVSATQSVPR